MTETVAKNRRDKDAFGHMLLDYLNGVDAEEIIEREDGFIDSSSGPVIYYFSDYPDWPAQQQEAMRRLVSGRTLDLGCGAGRVELYLQSLGCAATGIDISPLAVEVCRRRGVQDARLLSVTQLSTTVGIYDNIVMLGNNFGLMGNARRARWFLRKFLSMTTPHARIIAESNDIYHTENPDHLAYQAYNRERGRMSGQIRMRVRYRAFTSTWFDYLMVSPDEMREIVEGTGWHMIELIQSEGSSYVAVMEKTGQG